MSRRATPEANFEMSERIIHAMFNSSLFSPGCFWTKHISPQSYLLWIPSHCKRCYRMVLSIDVFPSSLGMQVNHGNSFQDIDVASFTCYAYLGTRAKFGLNLKLKAQVVTAGLKKWPQHKLHQPIGQLWPKCSGCCSRSQLLNPRTIGSNHTMH